jgi:arylformamidase
LKTPESDDERASGAAPVFLDYTQAELDHVYSQRAFAPNSEYIRRRLSRLSADIRARVAPPERHAYGSGAVEGIDVYRAAQPGAAVNIYIHGGAWRKGSAAASAYLAEVLGHAGAALAVPDFVAVEQAEDSLRTMVSQVRSAIAWVYRNAAAIGADANRLYVSAHSSGAHLAACALITDWAADFGLPPDIIKGAVCCSGMYDLKGPRLSVRSSYVPFDDAMEQALSPQRHIERIRAPVVVAYGTQETPEFQRQARDFAAALQAAGKPVELLVGHEYNHYEIRETFANPYGLIGSAVLRQMQLR